MAAGAMTDHVLRLVDAASRSLPATATFTGASEADLEHLVEAFGELRVPEELLDLLRTLNGSGGHDVLIGGFGPLNDAARVVTESAERADIAADSGTDFSPGWLVFAADGWAHAAVIAELAPRDRSAVIDLTYGNQAYPVAAASLTALVAASADAWEAGVHESQSWDTSEPGQARYRETEIVRQDLLARRSADYPSDDGLTSEDWVGFWRRAWPVSWPGRDEPESIPLYAATTLPTAPGSHEVIEAVVVEVLDRWVRVRQEDVEAWLALPPGLRKGHSLVPGSRATFSVQHNHRPGWASARPEDGPSFAVHATGVYDHAG